MNVMNEFSFPNKLVGTLDLESENSKKILKTDRGTTTGLQYKTRRCILSPVIFNFSAREEIIVREANITASFSR